MIGFDPMEFDGLLFGVIDDYRRDQLAAAEDLRRRIACTRALGDLLTPDVIARGRRILQDINVRNQEPLFPPLFLTFLNYPEWIGPTDAALRRLRAASSPKRYREFTRSAADQPMGGLFELNIFGWLDDAFPPAIPHPKLPHGGRADVRVTVDGVSVFVEATVIGEGQFWTNIGKMMHERGLRTYATAGPGPADDARRIVAKVAEELRQTVPDAPNVLFLSYFNQFPSAMAREWAIDDLWQGAAAYGTWKGGTQVDLSNLVRIDSIFECSRDRFLRLQINPNTDPACRLPASVRNQIHDALSAAPFMIR